MAWGGRDSGSAVAAALAAVVVFAAACAASAAEFAPPPPALPLTSDVVFAPPTLYHPERWELRGGVFAHAVASPESGSVDANVEVVAPKFFVIPGLPAFFTPRLHAGAILNTAGKTSYVYAGALWTADLTEHWFIEAFFGGLVHNGNLDDNADNMNGLGCRWAFHDGGSVGYRLDQHWSVMATYDHLSNGTICAFNKGINDYGLRLGYSF